MPDIAGGWHPDPYGRAELRWYDGAAWTTHVSTVGVQAQAPAEALPPAYAPPPAGYHPYPGGAAVATAQQSGRGRLVAAGALAIITGIVTLIAAIYLVTVLSSDVGQFFNAISGGVGTVTVLILVLFAAAYLWFGTAAAMGRAWSRIALAVISGIVELMLLLALISDGDGSPIVPILWFGTILGLAVSYRPEDGPGLS